MAQIPLTVRLRDAAGLVWSWLLPPACAGCHVPLDPEGGDFICHECRSSLRLIDPMMCERCAAPPQSAPGLDRCQVCHELPNSFATMRSAFPYAGTAGTMIRNLKYRQSTHAAPMLAQMTVGALSNHLKSLRDSNEAEVIVSVPMHRWRRWSRGQNHAELIAESMAELLAIPHEGHALERTRATPPQARRAKPKERLANVAGAFRVVEKQVIAGKGVLLVDDVMTTGATTACCAEAIMAAGARVVHIVTVARAGEARTIPLVS